MSRRLDPMIQQVYGVDVRLPTDIVRKRLLEIRRREFEGVEEENIGWGKNIARHLYMFDESILLHRKMTHLKLRGMDGLRYLRLQTSKVAGRCYILASRYFNHGTMGGYEV